MSIASSRVRQFRTTVVVAAVMSLDQNHIECDGGYSSRRFYISAVPVLACWSYSPAKGCVLNPAWTRSRAVPQRSESLPTGADETAIFVSLPEWLQVLSGNPKATRSLVIPPRRQTRHGDSSPDESQGRVRNAIYCVWTNMGLAAVFV